MWTWQLVTPTLLHESNAGLIFIIIVRHWFQSAHIIACTYVLLSVTPLIAI